MLPRVCPEPVDRDARSENTRASAGSTTGAHEEDTLTTAAEANQETDAVPCWCCGDQFTNDQVLRLGTHPEVAVCIGCTHYLYRRAKDHSPASAGARGVRRVMQAARGAVIRRRLHEKPVIGTALRWLDRHLP